MEWTKYLRVALYTGIFAVPFIGLIVLDSLFFPFITGKGFAFRIIVEITFALWAILALMQPEFRPRRSAALILGALFVLSLGVSTLLAENVTKALWSNFERMEGWVTLLHLGMYVTVLTSTLRTEVLWRRFFMTSIAASVVVGLYSFFQLVGALTINQGGVRVDATFGNATYFAVYMLIHAFLSLLALTRWSDGVRWKQVVFGLTFLMQVALVFYTATRGSILGLVGGLFLAGLIFAFSRGAGAWRKFGVGLVVLTLVAVGSFYAVRNTEYVQSHPIFARIASISLAEGNTRFQIWDMAWKGFQERPVFGWGQEGFNYVFNKYYYAELYTQEPWFDRAHNVVLDWLVAGGALGALLYLSLYAVLLYYLWRPGNPFDTAERALLTGLLAAYGFHNLFVFDNLMSYVLFGALFSYITVRAVPPVGWGTPLPAQTMQVAAPVVALAAVAMLYFVNAPGIASAKDLIEGIKPQAAGIATNLEHFETAVARGGLGAQEVAEQFVQFAAQVRSLNVGEPAFQLEVANKARDAMVAQVAAAPDDARLRIFLGSFLRQFGDYAGAAAQLEAGIKLSPEKQAIQFELGALKTQEGKIAEALQVFKDAYLLAPGYSQAVTQYAAAAIRAGDQALADSLLIPAFGTNTPPDQSVLQSYLAAKNYPKAVAVAEARVQQDPTNARMYLELAGVQIEAGNRAAAIVALEKAIEIDPTFKAQGEAYIAQIKAGTI